MTNQDDFRKAAEAALSEALTWRKDGPMLPAFPEASAADLRERFDIGLPDQGRDGVDVIEKLAFAAREGLVNNTHSNFFAWVQGSSHPVGVAADFLTSAWGQNAGIYLTTPAAAIAEEVAAKWLIDLLRLPESSSIAFATGATMASFICLAAARSEVLKRAGYDLETEGLIGAPQIHVFLGEEAHATILSDLRYLGFGEKELVRIAVDEEGRMLAACLKEKMDTISGPKIVISQAGHINSGAFDPFAEIISIARPHDAWVHVDGAFGLWANAFDELRDQCVGVEDADSWTVDGHKWLQVPYDSGFAIVRDSGPHRRAMSISASYIAEGTDDGRSPSSWVPELSRRARGFAVWAVLQALGRKGVEEMVLRHCRCAAHLAERLEGVVGIRLLNTVQLNQLSIAFGDSDEETDAVISEIQKENLNFVMGARWKGQSVMRVSVISRLTDIRDMDVLGDSILRAWKKVCK
jgi:glutamate/tyrosine decarboxylase-like PLP-dependent enzyme